jgi:hypothetical protein
MNTPYADFLEKHLIEKDITTLKEWYKRTKAQAHRQKIF